MRVPLTDLTRQYQAIKPEIDSAISKVLESGWFIQGGEVKAFENDFARYCGVKYAISLASGTDALKLSLIALGIGKGSEVITVSNTFVSTVDAIIHCGATPVLVDINPETYEMDISRVREKITKKTKAVIPVHLYGHPTEMRLLREVVEENGLFLIEDACQAHGTEYNGKKVGSFGDCGCFSFYPTKDLGAYGDGGLVTTNNPEVAEKLRMLREYGSRRKYYYDLIGFNSRLDEIQAAILRVKLRHLPEWINYRRRNAKRYHDMLSDSSEVILPVEKPYARHTYYVYVIRTKHRTKLQKFLQAKQIMTGIYYPVPVHLQKSYRFLRMRRGSLPETEKCSNEIISLPMFPELTDDEIEHVCTSIKTFFKELNKHAMRIPSAVLRVQLDD